MGQALSNLIRLLGCEETDLEKISKEEVKSTRKPGGAASSTIKGKLKKASLGLALDSEKRPYAISHDNEESEETRAKGSKEAQSKDIAVEDIGVQVERGLDTWSPKEEDAQALLGKDLEGEEVDLKSQSASWASFLLWHKAKTNLAV